MINALSTSRAEALASGSVHYFTGRECSRGHLSKRLASTGNCCACNLITNSEWKTKNRERLKQESREYNEQNRELRSASNSKWKQNNREQTSTYNREWKKRNKDRVCLYSQNRRAFNLGADGSYSNSDIAEIRILQRNKCACCRKNLRVGSHVDHIKPLSKGGSNNRSNLQILCAPCNISKHNRDPIDFMQSRGRLL